MYTAFYGLNEKPFALSPNPRFLFLSEAHREGLAHLIYGIEQNEGFISITGEVGTGKTTICRTLLDRLGPAPSVAFLFNPPSTATELVQSLSLEFGLPAVGLTRRELSAQLDRFLLEKKAEGRRVLLIVDEAQNLSSGTLEQIRLLSNLETESSKLIQILLLGQPELDEKLDTHRLRQLRQRISVRWKLRAMTRSETAAYVDHRIKVAAGGVRALFTAGALREVYWRTGGVPRLVNVLCDRALLAGYGAGAARVSAAHVREAAREIPDTRRRRLHLARLAESPRARWAGMLAVAVMLGGVGWLAFEAGVGAPGGPAPAARSAQSAESGPTPPVAAPAPVAPSAVAPGVAPPPAENAS